MLSKPILFLILATACMHHIGAAADSQPAQTDQQRLKWWTEARYGMFIHWSPVSVAGTELSWARNAKRPLDITGDPVGAGSDPVYDTLYQHFNPTQFNAAQWVKIAQDAGMKYMVLTCKHHEGFSMFHTKLSDYSIAKSPFKRDVVKELVDACHAAGMKFGVYYSPRDWHHPDYGVGDNRKYIDYMNGQLRELLTNYGKIDILWFDSYGYGDLEKFWRIEETWNLVKSLQPQIIINNRLAILNQYDKQPHPYIGDWDTPEQSIGRMQIDRPWESCMCLVGGQWSWLPNGEMKGFDEVVRDLVSCATGDGNLLLDVGPMPTGEIEQRQAHRLKEVGDWLRTNGASIYGTHGGPFANGVWGGSTFAGNKVWVHLFNPPGVIKLPKLNQKVVSHRSLTDDTYEMKDSDGRIVLSISKKKSQGPDAIVELTFDAPVTRVTELAEVGAVEMMNGNDLGSGASYTASSFVESFSGERNTLLKGTCAGEFAFHTRDEKDPWIVIDLQNVHRVEYVAITNRTTMPERAKTLTMWVSTDGDSWEKVWGADRGEASWEIRPEGIKAGAKITGIDCRYVKLGLREDVGTLHLRSVRIYGH